MNANFQAKFDRRIASIGVVAVVFGMHSLVGANPTTEIVSYAEPAPFTAKEFWQRFLQLANEIDDVPTRERVERMIGTKFARSVGDSFAQVFFLDYGSDWYFNAIFTARARRSSLEIWHTTPSSTQGADSGVNAFSDGPLLWLPAVDKTLVDSDWERYIPSPHVGPENRSYKRKNTEVGLTVVNNVISGIQIAWK